MRSLPPPTLAASVVLAACADSIRDPIVSAELSAVAGTVTLAEAEYHQHARDMTLHNIPCSLNVAGIVSGETMKRVYARTFVKSAETRPMYDSLKAAPQNDICPLCAQRTVSTLDHYLAQSLHANLTIVPLNLIPACSECNKSKLDHQPADAGDQSFHPYYDNFDDGKWLEAEVMQGSPAALRFHVVHPPGWSAIKALRAQNHFISLKLGPLYASHAGVELANMRFSLARISQRGGTADIRAFLDDRAASAQHVAQNSWQRATFEALSASDWFCSGGFAL